MSLSLGKGPLGLSLAQHHTEIPTLQRSPLCPTDYVSVDTDTTDTAVLPASMVGDERQPDVQLVTQEEPVVVPAAPVVPWRALIIRRALAAAAAVAILLLGVLVRVLSGNG